MQRESGTINTDLSVCKREGENKCRRNNTSFPSNERLHQSSLKKLATAVQQQSKAPSGQ
ncbi:hypothetical protein BDE02_17G024700 [Populus trichocarpa]|nr:hypothetical protein BDE02_17G024700 [Populus trichocarpa]